MRTQRNGDIAGLLAGVILIILAVLMKLLFLAGVIWVACSVIKHFFP